VGCPREFLHVTGGQTLFQVDDALWRVVEENADDLAEKRPSITRVERSEIFNRLGVNDRNIRHEGGSMGLWQPGVQPTESGFLGIGCVPGVIAQSTRIRAPGQCFKGWPSILGGKPLASA